MTDNGAAEAVALENSAGQESGSNVTVQSSTCRRFVNVTKCYNLNGVSRLASHSN